jgi:hypothetical protein
MKFIRIGLTENRISDCGRYRIILFPADRWSEKSYEIFLDHAMTGRSAKTLRDAKAIAANLSTASIERERVLADIRRGIKALGDRSEDRIGLLYDLLREALSKQELQRYRELDYLYLNDPEGDIGR